MEAICYVCFFSPFFLFSMFFKMTSDAPWIVCRNWLLELSSRIVFVWQCLFDQLAVFNPSKPILCVFLLFVFHLSSTSSKASMSSYVPYLYIGYLSHIRFWIYLSLKDSKQWCYLTKLSCAHCRVSSDSYIPIFSYIFKKFL